MSGLEWWNGLGFRVWGSGFRVQGLGFMSGLEWWNGLINVVHFHSVWCGIHGGVMLQGGENSYDPLSCRSLSTKEPLNIGHFCGK